MHHKQRGITFIGWLFLLIPIAIVFYAGMRLIPVYLNYTKVARVLEQVDEAVGEAEAATTNAQRIRTALDNRLNIEGVTFPTAEDITIRREGQTWFIQATYEDEAPLFWNISLHVLFDKTVEIK